MEDFNTKIVKLRDQTWQIARESLDGGETRVYRSLTDIAEKLTKLISSFDKSPIPINKKAEMLSIFARYKGERYEAQLDVARINGGRRPCVWMEEQWWTASGSTRQITNTSVNGWRHFWKYIKNGKIVPIEALKNKVN